MKRLEEGKLSKSALDLYINEVEESSKIMLTTLGRAYGSTGLGLNIVQNMVTTIFDGTIHYEAKRGGSRFVVYLPMEFANKQ